MRFQCGHSYPEWQKQKPSGKQNVCLINIIHFIVLYTKMARLSTKLKWQKPQKCALQVTAHWPWWGVCEWYATRGSSWRYPHSWCTHPPCHVWLEAWRKNRGTHNTEERKKWWLLIKKWTQESTMMLYSTAHKWNMLFSLLIHLENEALHLVAQQRTWKPHWFSTN